MASTLIGGLIIAMAGIAIRSQEWPGGPLRAAGDATLSTGSVLIVPVSGQLCRERVIDNSTWRMRDGGLVDCEAAMAKNDSGQDASGRWTGSRVDIIRDAFRHEP